MIPTRNRFNVNASPVNRPTRRSGFRTSHACVLLQQVVALSKAGELHVDKPRTLFAT
ncbi:Unknown protein sequence [Pseudomonas syringae pv. maculicola]|nr:Unknown protein sequence [Pseudomonas syringae pv. maculicola]